MERCVYNQLVNYLESNRLLSMRQFGFRKRKSTESATTLFFDEIRRAMDTGQLTGTIFIDLSKAFDTISHSILLSKLSSYGICNNEKQFFTDYLFSRWQYVNYKTSSSSCQPVFCGVPQGSILGPLLFILYFNDVEKQLVKCKIITYADDTIIYYHNKDLKIIEEVLANDFYHLSNWLNENELILNLKKDKTEIMIFGTKTNLSRRGNQINIEYQSKKINATESYNYLGVKVDPSLNLNFHFQSVYKKASSRLRLLRKIRSNLTNMAALRIYQAFVLPSILYCSCINYFQQPYRRDLLKFLECRAQNIINANGSKFPTIEHIHKRKVCKMVRKCINGELDNFRNYFDIIKHTKATRNNKLTIRLPMLRLESTKKSFYFYGALLYNSLPINLRAEESMRVFAEKLNSV